MRDITTEIVARKIAILQPGYLPWLGFFDQISRSDVFVIYDDVQFDKHGWRNRNRIKSPNGPVWLTVPVRHHGVGQPKNCEIRIDRTQSWTRKQLGNIRQYYASAPGFDSYFPTLSDILSKPWELLIDLNMALVKQFCQWLGIETQIIYSSSLDIGGKSSERLLKICGHLQAKHYLTGDAADAYLDESLFRDAGITVEHQHYQHPIYPQQYGEFISHLSVLDLLMNVGGESRKLFAHSGENS